MTTDLIERFDAIARHRLDELQEQYGRLSLLPLKPGDLEQQRRQNMFRSMLAHILLLQKALGLRATTPAGLFAPQEDQAALEAELAALREARHD